jgi:putative ABC transport system permease protein
MGYGATVIAMRDEMVGDVRPALLVLLGAVGLVLLIACANVANLLLARGEARQRELAVRVALGASRQRIVRQLLTESVVLALAGSVAGALLAWWGVRTMLAVNPDAIPRMQEVHVDATVGLVTLGVALVTGILFGLVPAMQMARVGVHDTLKEGLRGGSEGSGRRRLGRMLVVGELALAVVVVIGAGLLMRSFWALRATDPGFTPDRLLVVGLDVPGARYDDAGAIRFYRDLVERLRGLPGVESAAAASDLPPVAGGNNLDIQIDGRTLAPDATAPSPNVRSVTGDYFRTLAIQLARGRSLEPGDQTSALPVAVINETAARSYWPGTDPIGQRVRFSSRRSWMTIVGISRDVKSAGLGEPAPPEIYVPHGQLPQIGGGVERTMYAVVRTASDPAMLAPAARRVVRELDPLLAIRNVFTMDEMLSRSVAAPRFTMLLLAIFAAVALALAAVGIYGILSYSVKRRTREIGIRVALGGQPRHVLLLVVGQGMRLAVVGLGVGVVAALAVMRLTTKLLYGVSAADPMTFVAVVVLLAGVAFVASWLPARRAVSVDPRAALSVD